MSDVAGLDERLALTLTSKFSSAHNSFLDVCKTGTAEDVILAGDVLCKLYDDMDGSGLFSPEVMLPFHEAMEGVSFIMTMRREVGVEEMAFYKSVVQTLANEGPKVEF